jgi:hypothetical protein
VGIGLAGQVGGFVLEVVPYLLCHLITHLS